VNIGKRVMTGSRNTIAAVAVLALASACASMPALDKVRTVSLSTNFRSYGGLAVDVDGNPHTRPGKMAAEGLAITEGCGAFFIFCAVVTVPIGAAMGAAITAAETIPDEQAHELNRVSANVMAGLNLDASFGKAMREEASRQGIVLSGRRADARLNIVMTRFEWDVSVGNKVAIRIDFKVTGSADGKRGHRNITYISERAKAPVWIADSGKRIRQELTSIMDEASQKIWQQVLDRDA
jgi:hypothetical protein